MGKLLPEVESFLELGVALVEQHVHNVHLVHVTVLLEFLANLGADGGYGNVQRVHSLDLGGLCFHISLDTRIELGMDYMLARQYDPSVWGNWRANIVQGLWEPRAN